MSKSLWLRWLRSAVSVTWPALRRPHGLAWVALILLACSPPDRPSLQRVEVPSALAEFLPNGMQEAESIVPGVTLTSASWPARPLAVHLLSVDLGGCAIELEVLTASGSNSTDPGLATVSEMVQRSRRVVAAVNGDFFTPEGWPLGAEAAHGRVRRTRLRPAFAWQPRHQPWIGEAAMSGDTALDAGWILSRTAEGLPVRVLGGDPVLVAGGRVTAEIAGADRPSFSTTRHPRTAVGFDRGSDRLWLVVVDGRRDDYSEGMTLLELAELFVALGADEALNLDGGGSSAMIIQGRATNRPSDVTGERPVANALGVVWDPGACYRASETPR